MNPARRLQAVLTLLVFAIWIAGCSKPDLSRELVGYWTVKDEIGFVEFGEAGLYALATDGAPMEVGTWKVEEGRILLEALSGDRRGTTTTWNVALVDDGVFEHSLNKARFRRFVKDARHTEIFDKRLVGLWRSTESTNDIAEFTEHGTEMGLVWRKDAKKQDIVLGAWGRVTRRAGDKFALDGTVGTDVLSPRFVHKYEISGNRLTWTVGKRTRVMRRITLADVPRGDKPTAPAASTTP